MRLESGDTRDPARTWTTVATGQLPEQHGVHALETRRVAGMDGTLVTAERTPLGRSIDAVTDLLRLTTPAIATGRDWTDAGGLLSYGDDANTRYYRAATYIGKILKGVKPGDLPVEAPTKFELVINLKTAKQIGLTIPPNILARADRVIK